MRRFHQAKLEKQDKVIVWGSGTPRREFLHVDDLASACLYLMNLDVSEYRKHTKPALSHINVSAGDEISIHDLAHLIARVVGFKGEIVFDRSKPDGTPKRPLDITKLNNLGWQPGITLEQGLKDTYNWFLENIDSIRK